MPGSAYAQVRATATACATLPELVAFVENVDLLDTWIPDTKEARLLDRPSPTTQVYYIHTAMPWPVKHRDMVYLATEVPEDPPVQASIAVLLEGLPDYLPEYDGIVRMQSVSGRWDFHASDGRTQIEFELHIEPGGTLPVWLAQQRIVGTPRGMLRNLAQHFAAACQTSDAENADAAASH